MSKTKMLFRSDIAGLRAWAVLVVVLFHFNIPGFRGGFVGVDIFFAISGYLMTNIIIHGLENREFSIWDFYLARARRILPALMVMCAILLATGWFVLYPTDYRLLGMHALTSVLFLSNIQFWREAGYFDVVSHDKWLLHTWSLSVEWQFYLVFPILMWCVWKLWPGRRNALRLIVVLLFVSLALSVWLTSQNPVGAFFLLHTRAWEMLLGAVAALSADECRARVTSRGRLALERVGFAMLALSVVTANPDHWPGAAAVLPVLGAVLMLLAQRQDSVITSTVVFQRLGDWSYSIYLWHWPVAVALTYVGSQREANAVILGILLSLCLGGVSYRWVETLGRKQMAGVRTATATYVYVFIVLFVAAPALFIRLLDGIPGRLSPEIEEIAAGANDYNTLRDKSHSLGGRVFKKHVYGGNNIKAIVLGDSHASSIVTAVSASLKDSQDGVMGMSYSSCPTLLGVRNMRNDLHCAEFNEWAMQQMDVLPKQIPVIIVNRSSSYIYGSKYGSIEVNPSIYFENTLHKLEKGYSPLIKEYTDHFITTICKIAQNRQVILLRPLPEMPEDVPRSMSRAAQMERPLQIYMPLELYYLRNDVVWAAQDRAAEECGARIMNPLPLLCDDVICSGIDGNIPRYYDDNHLSESGNKKLISLFRLSEIK